jgi:type IV pilus assembly protein PilC
MAVKAVDGMKTFKYTAVRTDGVRIQNKIVAPTAGAVISLLQSEGHIPLNVDEVATTGWNFDIGAMFTNRPLKLSAPELAGFARQLHQLLKAGLSVPRALQAVGEDQNPKLAAVCQQMADKTAAGAPLAEVFAEHPSVFDDIFVSYIAAGEQTGELAAATKRLARMLEKRSALNLKIKSVTAYPKMVSIAICLMVVGILLFLVPRYAAMYAQFGSKLPGPTAALVAVSNSLLPVSMHHFGMLPFPIPLPKLTSPTLYLAAAWFGLKRWLAATSGNLEIGTRLDRIRFKLPIFGKLTGRMVTYRWSSTLAGALSSGLNMGPALDLAGRAAGSRWHLAVSGPLQDAVRSGRPLSEALADHPDLYPPSIRAMVRTGEGSGELAEMLDSVAGAVDDEIDSIVAGLGAKIEVALLMTMGVVVGGLLVVLYLPILNLATTAGSGLSGGSF